MSASEVSAERAGVPGTQPVLSLHWPIKASKPLVALVLNIKLPKIGGLFSVALGGQ